MKKQIAIIASFVLGLATITAQKTFTLTSSNLGGQMTKMQVFN